jgi:hypothetical protein
VSLGFSSDNISTIISILNLTNENCVKASLPHFCLGRRKAKTVLELLPLLQSLNFRQVKEEEFVSEDLESCIFRNV